MLFNIPEGYRAKIRGLEDAVTVKIIGLPSQIDAIREEDLEASIDVTAYLLAGEGEDFTAGTYYPPVNFVLPQYVSLKENVSVQMILEEE